MTVGYKTANKQEIEIPCIKLANRKMLEAGFQVGVKIEVRYYSGQIIIDLVRD